MKSFLLSLSALVLFAGGCQAQGAATVAPANGTPITQFGAVGDGTTLNTEKIQSGIDQLAAKGGGTLVVPQGVFLSGALFFKPGVNLYMAEGAVLKCSTDMKDFPAQRTRIEGHFEEHFNPGLINANACDGFHIGGKGTLDGDGRPVWDLFWKLRNAAPDRSNFPNLSVPRARLCIIENSKNVVVDGVTFKDSQYWNLHLYKCQEVQVQNARFEVPDDYKQAPSTDGIDVDSSQNVTITGCYFSVTDDCIAAKGSKGPNAMEDKDSPPVEHLRISDCTFKRGGGVLTLGSEATIVRDAVVENCKVIGPVNVAVLKLRGDTPQLYEDIHYRNITLDSGSERASLIAIKPWTQYYDLKGQPAPKSTVHDITFSNIKGRFGAFGTIKGNPGQTTMSDISLKDIEVQFTNEKLTLGEVKDLQVENVTVNGKPFSVKTTE